MSDKCSRCKMACSTFLCCKGVYYCDYRCQGNDETHYNLCERKKNIYSYENLTIVNSVYKFFVINITNILIEIEKYLSENNEIDVKPYVLVEFEEAIILTLSSLVDPSSINIMNMSDSIELLKEFEDKKFDFFENILFHFKSEGKHDFFFVYPFNRLHGSKINNQIALINQSPFIMNLEFLTGSTLYTVILSEECWKYSGFVDSYNKIYNK